MDRGRIVQVATPAEIYEQPQSRWVAEFIGDANLIEGAVVETRGALALIEDERGQRHCVADGGEPGASIAKGARVVIVLRPEKVRISPTPLPAETDNAAPGKVLDIGYLGGLSVYKVKLGNGRIMKAAVANVARATDAAIGWDQDVWLSWAPSAAVVLKT
jgi:putrescine transport system ATP-binding protein